MWVQSSKERDETEGQSPKSEERKNSMGQKASQKGFHWISGVDKGRREDYAREC